MSAELKEALGRLTWLGAPSSATRSDEAYQDWKNDVEIIVEAARRVAEADEVWEQAHRLREAILDTIDVQNVVNLSDMFHLLQDEGVLQAWCRVVQGRLLLPAEEEK